MADERRNSVRWRYVDSVIFTGKTASGPGHLANVSETGVFVRTGCCPAPGETVQILLRGSWPTIMLKGNVRWFGRLQDGTEGFGVQLEDPPPEYLELVRTVAAGDPSRQIRPFRTITILGGEPPG
jgi:hypothetical protein